MENLERAGFGGGCHWCTEAVFQRLKGVEKVEQGFIASIGKASSFSEAVIVHFDPGVISLDRLILIHLHTHSSSSLHRFREKYRSAIYTFSEEQEKQAGKILARHQKEFNHTLITRILPFREFRPSGEEFRNYYLQDRHKPFCRTYIEPKLEILSADFSENVKME
ncbi:peptide methionine sulfoxide reductase [Antarcticibacterium flavum]|uniref:peptide-methionine (S)-S-oxide reductase n=1 Tax=Antarcticibacterium flavum TaxID=2058175 RepID=A0A5B7WYL8_9FLAO|nr:MULTISPECIES: peptide-methionine (S)-S-oxide reductase [Antarcticibacterium]MCM4158904.1 peptide methionine sulfoxide reductase [Antarcticibacterium sp. W02-3]QCY68160.1 peptide methionine sulfoxide reductase [Antarcticibacterium flavum]